MPLDTSSDLPKKDAPVPGIEGTPRTPNDKSAAGIDAQIQLMGIGTATMVSGLANDLLRSEAYSAAVRNPLNPTWWEHNGNAATRELMYDVRVAVQPKIFGVDRALEHKQVVAAQLEASDAALRNMAPEVTPKVTQTWKQVQTHADAFKLEAQSIHRVLAAPEGKIPQEVARALKGNSEIITPDLRASLRSYSQLARSGEALGAAGLLDRNYLTGYARDFLDTSNQFRDMARSYEQQAAQAEFLANIERYDATAIRAQLGTRAEVAAGLKLIPSQSPLAASLRSHMDLLTTNGQASLRLAAAEKDLATQRALHHEPLLSVERGARLGGGRFLAGVGISAAAMGLGFGVDAALSKVLDTTAPSTDGKDGGSRLAIDGCLLPSVIMSELPTKYKLPLAATVFAAGRLAPLLPDNELLKPSHTDAFLIPATVLSPLGGKYKAASIAAAVGVGRAVNYFTGSDK